MSKAPMLRPVAPKTAAASFARSVVLGIPGGETGSGPSPVIVICELPESIPNASDKLRRLLPSRICP